MTGVFSKPQRRVAYPRAESRMTCSAKTDGVDDRGDQAPSEVDVDGGEVQQVEAELTTGFWVKGLQAERDGKGMAKGQGNVG